MQQDNDPEHNTKNKNQGVTMTQSKFIKVQPH